MSEAAAPDRPLVRLRHRREFLAAAKGFRWVGPAFVLQAAERAKPGGDASAMPPEAVGLGLTASRRVGGAVQRNRARRRLREAIRPLLPRLGVAGSDYVLVARGPVLTCPFAQLCGDLEAALRAYAARAAKRRASAGPRRS